MYFWSNVFRFSSFCVFFCFCINILSVSIVFSDSIHFFWQIIKKFYQSFYIIFIPAGDDIWGYSWFYYLISYK